MGSGSSGCGSRECWPGPEERQVDGFRHRLIPGVVWMNVIHRRPLRPQLSRTIRIAHRLVEIDHAVEGLAGSNPFVNGISLGFGLWGEIRREIPSYAFYRCNRPTEDLEPSSVRTLDELLVP